MVLKKGLLSKILLFVGVPVIVTYCVAGYISLQTVHKSVSQLTENELTAKSQAASYEIDGYFSNYMKMVNQITVGDQLQQFFEESVPGSSLNLNEYPYVAESLRNIKKADSETILNSWVADLDTKEMAHAEGTITITEWKETDTAWYEKLLSKKDTIITDPYVDAVSQATVISVVSPVYAEGTDELIGATGIDLSVLGYKNLMEQYALGENGFYILATEDGSILYHPNPDYQDVNVSQTDLSVNLQEAILNKTEGEIAFSGNGTENHGYVSTVGETGWVVATGLPDAEFNSTYAAVRTMILLIFGAALLVILGLMIFMTSRIVSPLNKLTRAAHKLAVGNVEVELDKVDPENIKDEIEDLMYAFEEMSQHIKDQAQIAQRVADGDLSVEIEPRSEEDILAISMNEVINALSNLVHEADQMTMEAVEGNLENRGNTEIFEGGYKEIISGFNRTLDAVIVPLRLSANYIERISRGDIPSKITEEYKGEYDYFKENINTCIDAINALIEDVSTLSGAALEGNLHTRADSEKHGGHFGKIIEGINQTLDSVINPLNTAAEYIDKIGKGEIPELITDTYHGDFNKLKTSINACIEGLGALVEGNDVLSKMRDNDFTDQIEGSYLGIYAEIGQSINNVIDTIRRVNAVISNVAQGELSDLEMLKHIGKRSENDELVPGLIAMVENIQALVEETTILSTSAVEGSLQARGDAGKFKGEYAKVIEGINETLDAIIAPIEEALGALKEMARGNLHVRVKGQYGGDHDELKNALNESLDNLLIYIDEISDALAQIGRGNFDIEITADYRGDFVAIKNSLTDIIYSLSQTMEDINQAADQVAASSRQVSDASQTLSNGSTEQASAIQELTASITEIAAQTRKNALNANEANQLATEAKDSAEEGNRQMASMLESMEDINASSANISKIIKVIDDIAFQTNILALNAAVEAARAGQHGKGFAVVAEEVRNLASRSADAAKETTTLIEGSTQRVEAGTKIAHETAGALKMIVSGIEKAADLVGSIANASNEQASGIAQINKGIEQVSHVVQNNSATAEESAAASEELYGQADLLKAMVGNFRIKANGTPQALSGTVAPGLPEAQEPQIFLGNDEYDKY